MLQEGNSVQAYPKSVVKDENNDTVWLRISKSYGVGDGSHAYGVTTSSAARKGSTMHNSGALFLSGGKPI